MHFTALSIHVYLFPHFITHVSPCGTSPLDFTGEGKLTGLDTRPPRSCFLSPSQSLNPGPQSSPAGMLSPTHLPSLPVPVVSLCREVLVMPFHCPHLSVLCSLLYAELRGRIRFPPSFKSLPRAQDQVAESIGPEPDPTGSQVPHESSLHSPFLPRLNPCLFTTQAFYTAQLQH